MGLIKFLLIAFLVFYLIVFVGRIAFRLWINKLQKEFIRRAQNGQPGGYYKQYTWGNKRTSPPNREGEVKISGKQPASKKINETIGEYVDYEEM